MCDQTINGQCRVWLPFAEMQLWLDYTINDGVAGFRRPARAY